MNDELASIIGRQQAAQVIIAGEVARAYFDLASPRHALEHAGSRQILCTYVVMAYRHARCRLHERRFAYAFLDILERVHDEVRELEVIDLFQDALSVALRIQERLAEFFYQLRYGRPHGAAYSFPVCFRAYSSSASVGSNESATELRQYRCPVVSSGPSGKRCPRWLPQRAQLTSAPNSG